MSYKTIIVHVDKALRPAECIRVAASLALADDAHLVGIATTGWSPFMLAGSGIDPLLPPMAQQFDILRRQGEAVLADFETHARQAGVQSFESRLVNEEAGAGLVLHGRCSDLVVMSQTRSELLPVTVRADVPEYALLNGARPVLLVPAAGSFDQPGQNVVVAWNGSVEATRAVTSALPLLKRARQVTVLVANPGLDVFEEEGEPGADIGLYLARHGVKTEVLVRTASDSVATIADTVASCNADLLVMGAYGHSRLREFILGGATRTMLREMRVPVWMAH